MAKKAKKEEQIEEAAIEETIEVATAAKLTCTVEGKQFIEKRIAIKYGEEVEVPLPYSDDLQSRVAVGFIKEVV